VTAAIAKIWTRARRRRAVGALLVAALWLKAVVLAVGLAQTAQASQPGAATAERDLLAALRVICTAGGAKVRGSSGQDGDARTSALHDCARCCSAPAHGTPPAGGAVLSAVFVFAAVPPVPEGVPPGEVPVTPTHPRAPPPSILS